jgi:PAS domain S-box-containing protein
MGEKAITGPSAETDSNSNGYFKRKWEETRRQLEFLRLLLDSINSCVVITDNEGTILFLNKPYGRLLGVDPQDQIGKPSCELVENTRMDIVARTGTAEINQTQRIRGRDRLVQRFPIKKDGKVIGVVGIMMFKDLKDVKELAEKLSLLESQVRFCHEELQSLSHTRYTLDSIVGSSAEIISIKKEALKAAAGDFNVLITGESGTGKEILAQAIHHAGNRRLYPFIGINCAAIPRDLLEAELFGYEKGAFTGALSTGKPGKFELANQGTIFLDEIGDLPLDMQPKLLRVLEGKEFQRVGGIRLIRSDFRLIAATNKNVSEMISENRFRMDLFYRLNVIPLNIPPLRERRRDILDLALHYLNLMAKDSPFSEIKIGPRASEALMNYDWPGNVRELFNVIQRVFYCLERDTIHLENLPFYVYEKQELSMGPNFSKLKEIVNRAEKQAILRALEASHFSRKKASQLLGIHRTLLYKKMKKYDISSGNADDDICV